MCLGVCMSIYRIAWAFEKQENIFLNKIPSPFFFLELSISLKCKSGQAGWSMQEEKIMLFHSTLLDMCKCTLSWSQLGIGASEKWCCKKSIINISCFLAHRIANCIFFFTVHSYFISEVITLRWEVLRSQFQVRSTLLVTTLRGKRRCNDELVMMN